MYTDRITGTSYVVEDTVQSAPIVIDTSNLVVEQAFDIEFDPVTAELINMGKRSKKTGEAEATLSPSKQAKPQTNGKDLYVLTIELFSLIIKFYITSQAANESNEDTEFFDPNETVRNDMSTDEGTDNTFFYRENNEGAEDQMPSSPQSNAYREHDMEEGSPSPSLPTTPENTSPHVNRGSNTGDTITDKMDMLDVPSTPIPAQVHLDLIAVRQAVENAGGLVSQKAPDLDKMKPCLLYTSPSPRDRQKSRMPSSA